MDLSQYSLFAIVLAALSGFAAGGLWYSPLLFGNAWMRESGMTEEKVKQASMGRIYGLAFVLSLIAAFVFALFLGPDPSLGLGVGAGFAAGAFWVAASFGINYLFEQKSLKLFLINGGYHTVQFTLIGLVLGLWP